MKVIFSSARSAVTSERARTPRKVVRPSVVRESRPGTKKDRYEAGSVFHELGPTYDQAQA
ncbi:hypothetical protein CG719_08405 [Streptomyces sp. CB01373]|nr:hypothetical protein CG719_08405 [Streptomyces sp. CB01373]